MTEPSPAASARAARDLVWLAAWKEASDELEQVHIDLRESQGLPGDHPDRQWLWAKHQELTGVMARLELRLLGPEPRLES